MEQASTELVSTVEENGEKSRSHVTKAFYIPYVGMCLHRSHGGRTIGLEWELIRNRCWSVYIGQGIGRHAVKATAKCDSRCLHIEVGDLGLESCSRIGTFISTRLGRRT
jgi:hypothetical protein